MVIDASTGRLPPDVAVIIPCLNAGPTLLECLHTLIVQHLQLEVIVVDNGSDDGTPQAVADSFPVASVIRNASNLGYAAACNQGAVAAQAPYLLFLNSDAVLTAGSLEELLGEARIDDTGGVWQPVVLNPAAALDSAGDMFTWWGFLWHKEVTPSQTNRPSPIFSAKGAALLVRRDLFLQLGGFQTSYFAYFEESDLCWRARMAGFEVRCIPSASLVHIGGQTTRRIFAPHEVRLLSFRNRLRSILANPSAVNVARILPRHVAGCVITAAAFAARGRPRSTISILRALVWPLVNWRDVKRQRREAQAVRRIPDTEVFRPSLVVRLTPSRSLQLLRGQIGRWEGHGR